MRRRAAFFAAACGAFAFAALGACATKYGGEEPPPGNEAGVDASDASEAAPPMDAIAPDVSTGACDTSKPFGTPKTVDGLTTPLHESIPRFTADELTVYFQASYMDAVGTSALYTARRPNLMAPFGTPTRLDTLDTAAHEAQPTLSEDGTFLLFARYDNNSDATMWKSQRSLSGGFGVPTPLDKLTANPEQGQPYLVPDALYFYAQAPSPGRSPDLYRAQRRNNDAFDVAVHLAELGSDGQDFQPTVTPDELTIYFASDRKTAGTKGQQDIWMATRSRREAPFQDIHPVAELNTSTNEYPGWVSADGCRLYFASDRVRGDGIADIYVAERPPR